MKYLKPYKIFESDQSENLKSHLDTIKDMFIEITDEYDMDYTIYYHAQGFWQHVATKSQNYDSGIFVDIEIDKKILYPYVSNGKVESIAHKFLQSVFSFADRVSSHCGLKINYCMGGEEVPGADMGVYGQRRWIIKNYDKNYGEYLQIYFTEK